MLKPNVRRQALARLDAWITPPVYTGKPPIMVADGSRQTDGRRRAAERDSPCPSSSELTVRINHANAARFSLRLAPAPRAATEPLAAETVATSSITAALNGKSRNALNSSETLHLAGGNRILDDGNAVARWTVEIIDDMPPTITLTEPPSEAQRGSFSSNTASGRLRRAVRPGGDRARR